MQCKQESRYGHIRLPLLLQNPFLSAWQWHEVMTAPRRRDVSAWLHIVLFHFCFWLLCGVLANEEIWQTTSWTDCLTKGPGFGTPRVEAVHLTMLLFEMAASFSGEGHGFDFGQHGIIERIHLREGFQHPIPKPHDLK